MKKTGFAIIVISVFFVFSPLQAQEKTNWGFSSNLLFDAALSPDIQLDFYTSKNIHLSLGGSYGWWGFDWGKKKAFQQWHINANANYYLRKDNSYVGHRLGLGAKTGQFDIKYKKDEARKGHISTIGLLYGYTWKLSDHFYLDAGLGIGYIYMFYHKYNYFPDRGSYCCISHPTKHLPGLTSLNLSIIYRFNGGRNR